MRALGLHHVSINVSDVEEARRFYVGSGRQAFTHDPSGNLVELHQPA